MNVSIATQLETDLAWLRWLLAPEIKEYKIACYCGGTQSAAVSLGRTIVGVHLEPVIVVVNSGTTDPEKVGKTLRSTRCGVPWSLNWVAAVLTDWKAV